MHYLLRTLAPTQSRPYAEARDELVWSTALGLLQGQSLPRDRLDEGWTVASLPGRLGGLGVRGAQFSSGPAYWASWADCLPMMRERNPALAGRLMHVLESNSDTEPGCLQELRDSRRSLIAEGFDGCPSWTAIWDGQRPPAPERSEAGDYAHGWQFLGSSTFELNRRSQMLLSLSRSRRAHLRSQSGPGANLALDTAPTGPEFALSSEKFLAIARRRLRWPLPLAAAACEGCGAELDECGDHRLACMRTGRVKRRAGALERALARICREAGGRVRMNARLVDMNVSVPAGDAREIEVLASGLPGLGGSQVAIDTTLRSVCHANGIPRARTHWQDGAVAADAVADKRAHYPELAVGTRCKLVVFSMEVGGRFDAQAVEFLRLVSKARAEVAPSYLRRLTAEALFSRWSRLAAVAAASSWAASVLSETRDGADEGFPDGGPLWVPDLLSDERPLLQ